jgi:hypothetical protein
MPLLGAELSVAVLERAPEVPARHRAVRAPLRADLLHVLWRGTFALAIRALDRVLDPEIQLRKHIGAAKPEHEEHLRRPSSNAFHLHEMGDEIVVGHPFHLVQGKLAARDLGCEVSHVSDFLAGEPNGAELLVRHAKDAFRRRLVSRKERVEPREDRSGGLAGQLLEYDGAGERLEVRPLGAQLQAANADGLNYLREDRVDPLEVADRGSMIGHADNLPVPAPVRFRCDAGLSRYRPTFRISLMNKRSAILR